MIEENMENRQYAGFWNRFHAVIVTTILLTLIEMVISYLLWNDFWMTNMNLFGVYDILVDHLLPMILTIILWVKYTSDPGKMLYRAQIVDASTYKKPTLKQFIIRYIGYYISLIPLGLGYFWVIWDDKKQAWHDKLAHTVVIKPIEAKHIKWYIQVYRAIMSILIVFTMIGLIASAFIEEEKKFQKVNELSEKQLVRLSDIDMKSVVYYAEAYSLVDEWIYHKYEIKTIDNNVICKMTLEDKITTKKSCYRFSEIKKFDMTFEGYEDDISVLLYDATVYSPYEYIGDGISDGLFMYGIIDAREKNDFNTTVIGLWKSASTVNRNDN